MKTKFTIVFLSGMIFAWVFPVRQAQASVYTDIGRIAAALERIADDMHNNKCLKSMKSFDSPSCGE